MTIDVARVRADTPGCDRVVHFNNAGSSLPPQQVVERQIAHLRREAEIGGYEAADEAGHELTAIYDKVARLVGAEAGEIALVENATVAWQMAFYSLEFSPGDRILTSQAEYGANYVAFLQQARRTGAVIEVIPNRETGKTSPEALDAMIDDRVRLVAITHVPTNGGLVNPAAEIGRVARRHGITYLLDACQSAGQMPLDVTELGCDFLSATGRKYLRAPRGTGFLYARKELAQSIDPVMIDHFSANWTALDRYELLPDAKRFENWENNYAARLGLGVALDYIDQLGIEAIWRRIQMLAEALRTRLATVPGVVLHDIGQEKCGIVSFTVDGRDPAAIRDRLRAHGINTSVSVPGSTLVDAVRRDLPALLRASVHYYNTDEELDRLCRSLRV